MKGLNKKQFKAWLKAKPANTIVGRAGRMDSCPIACYLKQTQDMDQVLVYSGYVRNKGWHDNRTRPLPQWAERFISRVDAGVYSTSNPPVSAERALAYMEDL